MAALPAMAEAAGSGWSARLDLRFEAIPEGRTRLVHVRHHGPLRLIRALPRPDGGCQAVIVHPPGGLVGGDRLELSMALGPNAQVLCTTPGAQKWYRSLGAAAQAQTRVCVGPQAALEWLPQPSLVFDRARVDQSLAFELDPQARLLGWEALVLGRAAMGERFGTGHLKQRLSLSVGGVLRWQEQTAADAQDRLFASPLGWSGRVAACTVWAAAPPDALHESLTEAWRATLHTACTTDAGRAVRLLGGVTRVSAGLLVARLLADDAEPMMRAAQALWSQARPGLLGAASPPPRIWAT